MPSKYRIKIKNVTNKLHCSTFLKTKNEQCTPKNGFMFYTSPNILEKVYLREEFEKNLRKAELLLERVIVLKISLPF